jgi:hypothetical protein
MDPVVSVVMVVMSLVEEDHNFYMLDQTAPGPAFPFCDLEDEPYEGGILHLLDIWNSNFEKKHHLKFEVLITLKGQIDYKMENGRTL